MQIEINQNVIYFWLLIIVFETIYQFVAFKMAWKKFKKETSRHEFTMMVINQLKETSSLKLLWKKIFNPASYVIGYIIFCIISPLLFPITLVSIFKKMIGYKSNLQKKAEAEAKAMDEEEKRSKEWMRNEGVYADDEIGEPKPFLKGIDQSNKEEN